MSVFIAYYSRAGENYFGGAYRTIPVGNTEKAARMLADITGGTLFSIQQQVPYSDRYQTCIEQAKQDLQNHARPALVALPEPNETYTDLYLGYPNYWGTMPMAVYTFLEQVPLAGVTIHPFCTHEGSGLSHTVADIRAAAPGAIVTAGLAIQGSRVDAARPQLEKWVRETEGLHG